MSPINWGCAMPVSDDVKALLDNIESSQRTLIFEQEAEIERLKSRLRFCDAVIRSGDVAALTEAERHALTDAAEAYEYDRDDSECVKIAATLRALLERLATAQVVAQTATSCGLTDAEREAVEWAVSAARNVEHPAEATLRGLLARLGGNADAVS